jgi:hypothetical protein
MPTPQFGPHLECLALCGAGFQPAHEPGIVSAEQSFTAYSDTIDTTGGAFAVYGSVLDSGTSDPTNVPGL